MASHLLDMGNRVNVAEKTMNSVYQNFLALSANVNKANQDLVAKLETLESRISDLETAASKEKTPVKNLSYMKNHN